MAPSKPTLIRALDWGSWVTLAVTVLLFILAVIEKGLTRDVLLEAGVFLISVKLVISASKTHALLEELKKKLDDLTDQKK